MKYNEYIKGLISNEKMDFAVRETIEEAKKETVKINNFQEIKEAYTTVIETIFANYKSERIAPSGAIKDIKLNQLLTSEIKEKIDYINNNIDIQAISYRIDASYIRAYYGGYQIAYLSLGNKKLSYNSETEEGFLIWNLVGKLTCYGSTKLCRSICYNNSRSYGNNIKTKIRNTITSMLGGFETIMSNMIKLTPYKNTYIRIHEDGDFYDTKYFQKWVNIADNTNADVKSITAYTKDFRVLRHINDTNKKSKLYVKYSLMKDTQQKVIDYVITNNVPVYTVIDNNTVEGYSADELFNMMNKEQQCFCNCQCCKKCYQKEYHTLVCKAH